MTGILPTMTRDFRADITWEYLKWLWTQILPRRQHSGSAEGGYSFRLTCTKSHSLLLIVINFLVLKNTFKPYLWSLKKTPHFVMYIMKIILIKAIKHFNFQSFMKLHWNVLPIYPSSPFGSKREIMRLPLVVFHLSLSFIINFIKVSKLLGGYAKKEPHYQLGTPNYK